LWFAENGCCPAGSDELRVINVIANERVLTLDAGKLAKPPQMPPRAGNGRRTLDTRNAERCCSLSWQSFCATARSPNPLEKKVNEMNQTIDPVAAAKAIVEVLS